MQAIETERLLMIPTRKSSYQYSTVVSTPVSHC